MIEVHERVVVEADPDQVWRIVSNPDEVVTLIPGAALEERHDDGSYSGSMTVQFGPAKVKFHARVNFEVDDAARIGRISGRGKDSAGGTKAKMAFTFALGEEGGMTVVTGDGEVEMSGRLAGMIEAGAAIVIQRMLADFTARLAQRCAPPPAAGAAPSAPPSSGWWGRVLARFKTWFGIGQS